MASDDQTKFLEDSFGRFARPGSGSLSAADPLPISTNLSTALGSGDLLPAKVIPFTVDDFTNHPLLNGQTAHDGALEFDLSNSVINVNQYGLYWLLWFVRLDNTSGVDAGFWVSLRYRVTSADGANSVGNQETSHIWIPAGGHVFVANNFLQWCGPGSSFSLQCQLPAGGTLGPEATLYTYKMG